jgi:hypothetical protein
MVGRLKDVDLVCQANQMLHPRLCKPSRRRIKGDGNVNETEAGAAFPDCAYTQLFRRASRICADEDIDLATWRAPRRQRPILGHDGACPFIAGLGR